MSSRPALAEAVAPAERLASLDWIRGLAALAVVLYHTEIAARSYLRDLAAPQADLAAWFGAGWMGVPVFFALSGDVIARSISRRPQPVGTFLQRRFWRLYPTYLVLTLVFVGLLAVLPEGATRHETVSGAKLLSSLVFGWGQSHLAYLYVGWTLFWEVLFYLLAAPFAPRGQRLPLLPLLLALPLAAGAALPLPDGALAQQLLTYLAAFLAGLASFALPQLLTAPAARQPRHRALVLGAYAIGLGLLAVNPFERSFGLAAALTSLLLWSGVAVERRRPQLFTQPLPGWLGQISYSLFLVHSITVPAVMKALAVLLGSTGLIGLPFPLLNALAAVLTVTVSLAAAWLSWQCLERWLTQRLQALVSGRRAPRQTA